MATSNDRTVHKHFRLDSIKLKRAQKLLQARTETETVQRALDFAIAEYQRCKLTEEANRKFLRSGAVIRDVFGTVNDQAWIRKASGPEGSGVRGPKALRALRGSADTRMSTDEIMALTREGSRSDANGI
jgi:hypothetical protein